jgi:hypothetical protein
VRRYRVTLADEGREGLGRLLARGRADVRELERARLLLEAGEAGGGPGWTDERIVGVPDVGAATVRRPGRRAVCRRRPGADRGARRASRRR